MEFHSKPSPKVSLKKATAKKFSFFTLATLHTMMIKFDCSSKNFLLIFFMRENKTVNECACKMLEKE